MEDKKKKDKDKKKEDEDNSDKKKSDDKKEKKNKDKKGKVSWVFVSRLKYTISSLAEHFLVFHSVANCRLGSICVGTLNEFPIIAWLVTGLLNNHLAGQFLGLV